MEKNSSVLDQTRPNSNKNFDMGGRGNLDKEEELEDKDGSHIQLSIDGRVGPAKINSKANHAHLPWYRVSKQS